MTRVGVAGHRGLSPETARLVSDALLQEISRYRAADLVGVTALADGADQLFAQAVLDRGGTLDVIVPAAEYRAGLPADCHEMYDKLMAVAASVHRLDRIESDEQAHMAASHLMLEMIDKLIAVWDGQPARGYGGTADVVAAAQDRDLPVQVIWPTGAKRAYS